jgi:hypothetical protein
VAIHIAVGLVSILADWVGELVGGCLGEVWLNAMDMVTLLYCKDYCCCEFFVCSFITKIFFIYFHQKNYSNNFSLFDPFCGVSLRKLITQIKLEG